MSTLSDYFHSQPDFFECIAERITQGQRQQDAGAEQLAARLGTVALDGSAGVFDCIAERLTTMDLEQVRPGECRWPWVRLIPEPASNAF